MLISNTGPNIWGNIKLKYIPQLIRPKLKKEPWTTLYVEPFGRDQEVGGGRKQKRTFSTVVCHLSYLRELIVRTWNFSFDALYVMKQIDKYRYLFITTRLKLKMFPPASYIYPWPIPPFLWRVLRYIANPWELSTGLTGLKLYSYRCIGWLGIGFKGTVYRIRYALLEA